MLQIGEPRPRPCDAAHQRIEIGLLHGSFSPLEGREEFLHDRPILVGDCSRCYLDCRSRRRRTVSITVERAGDLALLLRHGLSGDEP